MNLDDKKNCMDLRRRIFTVGYRGGAAHFASAFSSVEIIYTLYMKGVMNYDPKKPKLPNRDRFVLSKGHAGLALYAVLEMAGMMTKEQMDTYLQSGSDLGGEPCVRDLDCVEATTGSLGHGLSVAAGMALGQKIDNSGAKTFVVLGDGECQEGSVWEALMAAPMLGLDNLTVILDANRIQKMDFIENIIPEHADWRKRIEPFGWEVREADGHNVDVLKSCLKEENDSQKPVFIIANTIKGKGVSIMENNPNWHFKMPNKKEKRIIMEELGIGEGEL